MHKLGLLIALAWICPALADDVALVRVSDPWRLFKGRAEPSAIAGDWVRPAFQDTLWPIAASGFAFDGSVTEATVLHDSPRDYTTVYLRRPFRLGHPESVQWLTLRVLYGAGFVAYLNGAEVARRAVPGDPGTWVAYNTLAEGNQRNRFEEVDLTTSIPLLVGGTNLLAIQWLAGATETAGARFCAELMANFVRGPFLQDAGTDHQTIAWKTPVPSDSSVEFGLTPSLGSRWTDGNSVVTHVATLRNLTPDSLYYYRVGSTALGRTAISPLWTFRTFKSSGAVTFVAAGDLGEETTAQYALANVMQQAQPDLVFIDGDVVYPAWSPELADTHFFSVYSSQMRTTPFFVVAGNHDVVYGNEKDFYDSIFPPTNDVDAATHFAATTGPKYYYGAINLIPLGRIPSERYHRPVGGSEPDLSPGLAPPTCETTTRASVTAVG